MTKNKTKQNHDYGSVNIYTDTSMYSMLNSFLYYSLMQFSVTPQTLSIIHNQYTYRRCNVIKDFRSKTQYLNFSKFEIFAIEAAEIPKKKH